MIPQSSQQLESYIPVHDAIPEEWEDARAFLTEQLKEISNAINVREIGFFLDEELISGKQFIPSSSSSLPSSGSSQQFRTILRKVVDLGGLVVGANSFPHGVVFDSNLTSIDSWVEATNSTSLLAVTLVYPNVVITATNVVINSPSNFDRAYFIWEYIQEL